MKALRPIWVNLSNFIDLLRDRETQEILSEKLSDYAAQNNDTVTDSHRRETGAFFTVLLKDLRLFDITDSKYWGWCLVCVAAYLGIEVIVVYSQKNLPFKDLILLLGFLLVLSLFFYLLVFLYFLKEKKSFSYTVPVVVTGIGMILLNFILIAFTGWKNSPFLPAYTFTNITIITAPRENSKPIILLSAFAFLFLLLPYCVPDIFCQRNEDLQWTSIIINTLTLVFTIGTVLILRAHSSKRIMNKDPL